MRKKRNWSIFDNSGRARRYRKFLYWKEYFSFKFRRKYNKSARIW